MVCICDSSPRLSERTPFDEVSGGGDIDTDGVLKRLIEDSVSSDESRTQESDSMDGMGVSADVEVLVSDMLIYFNLLDNCW
jgi:hypothetical protein